MSWVMSTTDEPVSRRSVRIRSRICAWIVTSSAVVGSSAIRSPRPARQRHRDHHALAHAARELVREVVHALLRRRRSRPRAAARPRGRAPPPRTAPRARAAARRSASRPGRPGSATVIGSWKIIAISLPRTSRIARCGQLHQVAAAVVDLALEARVALRRPAASRSASSRSCPTRTRRRSRAPRPAPSANETPSTARHLAGVGEEGDAQVADVEQRLAHAVTASRVRGSSRA